MYVPGACVDVNVGVTVAVSVIVEVDVAVAAVSVAVIVNVAVAGTPAPGDAGLFVFVHEAIKIVNKMARKSGGNISFFIKNSFRFNYYIFSSILP